MKILDCRLCEAVPGTLWVYPLGSQRDKVTILSLVDGLYGETVFENEQTIASKVIPQFSRTAADILRICENL